MINPYWTNGWMPPPLAPPSDFLNAALKRLKQLKLNLVTFPKYVSVTFLNSKIGNIGIPFCHGNRSERSRSPVKNERSQEMWQKLKLLSFLNESAISFEIFSSEH